MPALGRPRGHHHARGGVEERVEDQVRVVEVERVLGGVATVLAQLAVVLGRLLRRARELELDDPHFAHVVDGRQRERAHAEREQQEPEDDQSAVGAFRNGRHTEVNTERPDFSSTWG